MSIKNKYYSHSIVTGLLLSVLLSCASAQKAVKPFPQRSNGMYILPNSDVAAYWALCFESHFSGLPRVGQDHVIGIWDDCNLDMVDTLSPTNPEYQKYNFGRHYISVFWQYHDTILYNDYSCSIKYDAFETKPIRPADTFYSNTIQYKGNKIFLDWYNMNGYYKDRVIVKDTNPDRFFVILDTVAHTKTSWKYQEPTVRPIIEEQIYYKSVADIYKRMFKYRLQCLRNDTNTLGRWLGRRLG
jgi:hypothetical protein